MFAATESDFEPDIADRPVEQPGEIRWTRAANLQRKPRQQMFDQVGLVRAQPVTLAPAEERAVRVNDVGIVGRGVAIAGIADRMR